MTLVNSTNIQFNATFITPTLLGLYNITILANDTSDNRNASETTNFTLINLVPVINITEPLGPENLSGDVFINITWA